MFTGPICSSFCRSAAARLFFGGQRFAGNARNLRIAAQRRCLDIYFGQAARFQMLQVRPQLRQLGCARCAIFAQLVQSRRARLQFCLHRPPAAAATACACVRQRCACARASARSAVNSFCVRRKLLAFPRPLLAVPLRLPRAAAQSRSTRRSRSRMQPVDALESRLRPAPPLLQPASSAVNCAASCCSALARLPHRRQLGSAASSSPASACSCSASSRTVSSRFCSIDCLLGLARVLVARGLHRPVLQPALDALHLGFHLLQRRALVRRYRAPPAAALRCVPPAVAVSSSICRVSAAASSLGLAQIALQRRELLSVSRNSRFSASGPSLAGLPPVTVALWKHSPPGVRKNACEYLDRQRLRHVRDLHQVSIAQLRQNRLQRPAKSIQHAHRIFQRRHARTADLSRHLVKQSFACAIFG